MLNLASRRGFNAAVRQLPRLFHSSSSAKRILHPAVRRLPSIALRRFTSNTSAEAKAAVEKPTTTLGKFRQYLKMYGAVFVVTYIGIYIGTLALIYTAIVSGETPALPSHYFSASLPVPITSATYLVITGLLSGESLIIVIMSRPFLPRLVLKCCDDLQVLLTWTLMISSTVPDPF